MDGVVFGPRGFDRAGESEDVVAVDVVVRGGSGGKPFGAVFDGVFGVVEDEFTSGWGWRDRRRYAPSPNQRVARGGCRPWSSGGARSGGFYAQTSAWK